MKQVEFEFILLEQRGAVGLITLNRPEKLNAWSGEMRAEIRRAMEECVASPEVGAIVLTGAGRAYCAGADVGNLEKKSEQRDRGENPEPDLKTVQGGDWTEYLLSLPKPTIAAVNGAALAGGCGIATLCDFTLAVPEARFGYTEVKIGFLPALVSVFLIRQIGEKRTRDLLLTGRIMEAEDARAIGLVNEIVAAEKLLTRSRELADLLIAASPASLSRAKRLMTSAAAPAVDHDLERAILENARIRCTPDFKEGLASFLEKRKPVWQGKPE